MNINRPITHNFNLREAFTWAKKWLTTEQYDRYLEECEKEHTPEREAALIRELKRAQTYRDAINRKFPEFGNKVGVRITSGVRPLWYERLKGRAGGSRHVQWDALDFDITGVSEPKRSAILKWLWLDIDANHNGGAAISYRQDGTIAFIHVDSGTRRRWKYPLK
jgi:uncharacterized protein YcbK (DUF882 family)